MYVDFCHFLVIGWDLRILKWEEREYLFLPSCFHFCLLFAYFQFFEVVFTLLLWLCYLVVYLKLFACFCGDFYQNKLCLWKLYFVLLFYDFVDYVFLSIGGMCNLHLYNQQTCKCNSILLFLMNRSHVYQLFLKRTTRTTLLDALNTLRLIFFPISSLLLHFQKTGRFPLFFPI